MYKRQGLKNVAAGANPMIIRRGIQKAVEVAVEEIGKISHPVESKAAIAQVASISAADEATGQLIADAMEIVGNDGVITVEAVSYTHLDVYKRQEYVHPAGIIKIVR